MGTINLRQNNRSKIRMITKRAFLQRFTADERIAFRKSTNDYVIDMYEDLKLASYVDLDLPTLYQGLSLLVSLSLLGSDRITEVLRDGTPEEV